MNEEYYDSDEKVAGKVPCVVRRRDGYTVSVYYKGKEVLWWNDSAGVEYPEDLTYGRDIGKVFQQGVLLGIQYAKEQDNG